MKQLNPTVTEYIAKSADFAKPILNHLRQLIFEACPDVEESIKWGTPHYGYKDDHLCMMAGFKQHCSFSLYKAELMADAQIKESVKAGKKFGYMDKVKDLAELPPKKTLTAYLKEAMAINESGIKKAKPAKAKPAVVETPDYFLQALKKNPSAKTVFESKSDSFRKEYLKWIIEAKTDETREKRIQQSLEWIAEGKGRFWQYAK